MCIMKTGYGKVKTMATDKMQVARETFTRKHFLDSGKCRLAAITIAILCSVQGCSAMCKFPGAPAHSTVTFSEEFLVAGAVATYTCERGFELLGPSRRTCAEDGQWVPEGIPFCVLNVAAGKAPMQISTELGGIPQRAIDGSTASFFSADTCTLTKPEHVPWWYVNLLEPYMVQLVRLDFGKPCCGANKPAVIVVRVGNNRPDLGTNPICNRFTGFLEEGQPLFLPCNPPMPGAFVSVHLEVSSSSQLSICEAFVYTDQALPIERCPQFRDQPPGSTATYNGKCYIFYNRQPVVFRDALAYCRGRGGTLVDESNPALQGFISWELWRRHRSDSSSQYWMGAVRDQNDRNNWKWLNGDDVTVSFWNLPGGDDDCARFDGSKGWLWSDTNCLTSLNFICQHQPKACGRPEQPPNSTMVSQNFNVGATVEYSCDEGHLLVGPTSRTCLDTGFYNEFPPVCKRIQCGYPADIMNGGYQLVNGSVGYLSHVLYNCEEGYEMIGRSLLTCDIDERWNGPPPRCEVVQCESPPEIFNGRNELSSNDSSYGSTVEYFCLRGFKLSGAKRLSCLASGLWDNPAPTCRADEPVTIPATTVAPTRATRPSTRLVTRPAQTPLATQTTAPVITTTATPKLVRRPTASPPRRMHHDAADSGTAHVPHIIVASHPQETSNQIIGLNNNIRSEQTKVNVPLSVEGDRKDALGAKLNLGAIIALGAFGGIVFLVAIITTIVILVRRNRSAKHYRHHVSPDCNTVASFDSSSSESRNGLNRYYRQAWENLHESATSKAMSKSSTHSPLRRKETMDEPSSYRNQQREALKDGSELVISDVSAYPPRGHPDKKRHHHHHHHREPHSGVRHGSAREWAPAGRERDARSSHHNHKPRY